MYMCGDVFAYLIIILFLSVFPKLDFFIGAYRVLEKRSSLAAGGCLILR